MKRIIMLSTTNKADIYELLKVIWSQPTHIALSKMLTKNRDDAKLSLKYHKGLVTNHIRKDILKRKKKDCICIGHYADGDNKFKYIHAAYVKEYFDVLAPYIDMIEESEEIYRITLEHAEDFIEDYILKTTCIDDHMKITAIHDRFVTTNFETGSGHSRHSMLIMTGYDMSQKMVNLHAEIKAMNKFKPFSKAEVVYATVRDGMDIIENIKLYRCDVEKGIEFKDRGDFRGLNPESDRDLNKLIKRSVCYFV